MLKILFSIKGISFYCFKIWLNKVYRACVQQCPRLVIKTDAPTLRVFFCRSEEDLRYQLLDVWLQSQDAIACMLTSTWISVCTVWLMSRWCLSCQTIHSEIFYIEYRIEAVNMSNRQQPDHTSSKTQPKASNGTQSRTRRLASTVPITIMDTCFKIR